MRHLLRIDLGAQKARQEALAPEYKGLGGRGLTSTIVAREVPAVVDPLAEENKLVFAAGVTAGTVVPNNGRLSVGAKSPLTGGIKEANAGGSAAQKIARLGFQACVAEGRARELTVVKIDKGGVSFLPAGPLAGLGNYAVIERLKAEYGEGVSIISIGPAGEKRLKAASISVTSPDFHIRVAARGGMGAVMGSKNLKAIVIDDAGSDRVDVQDREKLKVSAGALSKAILSNPVAQMFRELGTPGLVMMVNGFGCLPTKNYSVGQFQGAEKICGEYAAEVMKRRPNAKTTHRCMDGCLIGCSNVYTDEHGETIVSGLEYETIGLTGSNCMIDDLDTIARINRVCNDLGLDTMDVGSALAVAMEAGMLSWGDGAAALKLLQGVSTGNDQGMMIGNGSRFTGDRLGARRVPTVKGQGLSAYDPRGLKGIGVTYCTSPMGADHTSGIVLPNPGQPEYSPVAPAGQAAPSQFMQTYMAAIDTLGLCMMAGIATLETASEPHLISCISAITGEPLGGQYLLDLGRSVLQVETGFNRAAGLTEKDDRLPRFFYEEKLLPGGAIWDVPDEEIDGVHRF